MHSLTDRRDPDFICDWCVKRAEGHLIDGAQPEYHEAFCRYCSCSKRVSESHHYTFPEGQGPRVAISGITVSLNTPGRLHKRICWPCARQAGGWRAGGSWFRYFQSRCDFCGAYRLATDVINYNFTTMPTVKVKPEGAGR